VFDSELEALYEKIPTFKCIPGCMDCCGPVPFSKVEWERVKDKRKARSLKCPYAVDGKCEIYEVRPFVCRLFGAVDTPTMTCPYGRGPENKLTEAEARELTFRYLNILARG